MAELNIPRAHSDAWYDQLAGVQAGYYYPWQSTLGIGDGEQAFMDLVFRHVTPSSHILEIGCGHGDLTLRLAKYCAKVTAYDRVPAYIELANQQRTSQGAANVSFVCHDARQGEDIKLPVADHSVDLIIGRRAPLHWISDAIRVAKPGAKIVFLSPMEEPIPAWSSKLPPKLHYENSGRHTGNGSIHQSVENRLHQAGLTLHSGWSFDVPERFADQAALYTMLSWGIPEADRPSFTDVETKLDQVFAKFATLDGIELRHCRYLWHALLPARS